MQCWLHKGISLRRSVSREQSSFISHPSVIQLQRTVDGEFASCGAMCPPHTSLPKTQRAKTDWETEICCSRLSKGSFKLQLLPAVSAQECELRAGIRTLQLSHLDTSCGIHLPVSQDHVQTIFARCLPSLSWQLVRQWWAIRAPHAPWLPDSLPYIGNGEK